MQNNECLNLKNTLLSIKAFIPSFAWLSSITNSSGLIEIVTFPLTFLSFMLVKFMSYFPAIFKAEPSKVPFNTFVLPMKVATNKLAGLW